MKRKKSLIVILLLTLALSLTPVPRLRAGEVTGLVEPPSDLGVISVGSNAALGFGANFSDAAQSMAIVLVNYTDPGLTYAGFTAEMDGANASDQFDLDVGAGTLMLNCSAIQPANGTLSVELTFRAEAAGNYTFDWRYVYVAFQEPPDPPATVDESGSTVVEAIYGMEVPLYVGWNLVGVPSNLVDQSVEGVFHGNLSRVEYVYGFDNEAKDYVYWINGLPPEYQTLRLLEPGKGYWVFVNEDFNQTIRYRGYNFSLPKPYGGTLTIATPLDPPEQNQWNAGATASYYFLDPMSDYLTREDPLSGEVIPWIAESWEVSVDKLSYVVHLKRGVKFHDGIELTAEDVKWCFDFIMENNFTRMSDVWQRMSREKPTEIIDDYTLRFHLAEPYVPFPRETLATPAIVPKHVWEPISQRPGFDWLTYVPTLEEQVGSGPFKLVEYVPGSFYKYEAFEDYWHGRPYVDYFLRPIITSGDAELLALKRGDVDAFTGFLAFEAIPGLLSDPDIGFHIYNNPYMYHWGMNNYKWPFTEKEFRFALAHAIDKQDIVDTLLLGYGLPGTHGVEAPFYNFWFNPNVPETYYFNLTIAAQMLDDLGWVDTDGDGVREGTGDHAGEPLEFDIGPPIYDPVRCRAAELLSTWFAEIGVDATVQYMEWATLWGKIIQPLDSPTKIDSWLLGSSQSPEPSWMHRRLHSDNIPNPNYYGFVNAEYDELAMLQGSQFNSSERQASIWRMQEILAEEVPLVVLYFRQSPSVYRTDKLEGWVRPIRGGVNNVWSWMNVHLVINQP